MRCQQEVFHDSMRIDTLDTKSRVLTKLGEDRYWEDGSSINLYETEWDYKQYDSFVSAYTGRSLTDQFDALNAGRGVLNAITKNTGRAFIFGLPIDDFHRALLWKSHHGNTLTRREGFPSWSWAGWKGRTEYAYWVGDMADYTNEGNPRLKKRLRREEAFDSMQLPQMEIVGLPSNEAGPGMIKLSSEIVKFYLKLMRTDGDPHVWQMLKSPSSNSAVGDHWTLATVGSNTRILRDTAGENEVFENTDFFFRMHPSYRQTLEKFEIGRRPAEFLLIQTWPSIRDSKISNKRRQNMVSALLINELENGTYERLASILLPLHKWQEAKSVHRIIELI